MNEAKKHPTRGKFILDENNNPIACSDLLEWGKWLEDNDGVRIVKHDHLGNPEDPAHHVLVSTVFLGMDMLYDMQVRHRPVLWETMIFGGQYDMWQHRWSSFVEAQEGHEMALAAATLMFEQGIATEGFDE